MMTKVQTGDASLPHGGTVEVLGVGLKGGEEEEGVAGMVGGEDEGAEEGVATGTSGRGDLEVEVGAGIGTVATLGEPVEVLTSALLWMGVSQT